MKNKIKEIRLRYNDRAELRYLALCSEAYVETMGEQKDTTSGFKSLRIFKIEDKKENVKVDIAVRKTPTGLVIAEPQSIIEVLHDTRNKNG